MGIERWHEIIREQEGKTNRDDYWTAPVKSVEGASFFLVSIVSVKKGHILGLEEGVYAVTNITLQDFRDQPLLQNLFIEHLFQELERVPLKFSPSHRSPDGAVIFKVDQATQSEVDSVAQVYQGHNFSKN